MLTLLNFSTQGRLFPLRANTQTTWRLASLLIDDRWLCCKLTDCSGLKTFVFIYFLNAYTLFPPNSLGISTVLLTLGYRWIFCFEIHKLTRPVKSQYATQTTLKQQLQSRYKYKSSSSLCHAVSTDFFDSLTPSILIIHRFR